MASIQIPEDLPVFQQDGDMLVPTRLAVGPWYEGTQHGSSMLLLAALAAEKAPSDSPRQLTRLTVDMMKAAPMAPIQLVTQVRKGGRYMDVLDISIRSNGDEFVRASALYFRVDDVPVPERVNYSGPVPQLPPPLTKPLFEHVSNQEGFHHAIDVRVDVETKPAVMWFRMKQPVVDDLPITPLLRVALAADWTYSIPNISNRILTGESFASQPFFGINPDTTINLHRPAQGEWIGIQTTPAFDAYGAGTAMGKVFDQNGIIGFVNQSILIRGRGAAPMQVKQSAKK